MLSHFLDFLGNVVLSSAVGWAIWYAGGKIPPEIFRVIVSAGAVVVVWTFLYPAKLTFLSTRPNKRHEDCA